MSWLRRLFGGADGANGEDRYEASRGDDFDELGGDGGTRPLGEAKPELLRLLRERGARAAVIAYDGGNDEGGVTEIWISREPLSVDPREWNEEKLPAGEEVEVDWDTIESDPPGLLDYAMDVVCDKWGSFAGEFAVRGRLVVDVDSGGIARHDEMWGFTEEDYDELDEAEDDIPKRPPDERTVEAV